MIQQKFNEQNSSQILLDVPFCGLIILTKITPIMLFFFLSQNKIVDFTLVLLTASADFWMTKNISGRKLVGMTWWMRINQQTGEQTWIFHSTDCQFINQINFNIFWSANLGSSIFWGFTTLLSLLISRLFWISICAVCFILSTINFFFFLRCRGIHQQKFKGLAHKMGINSAHTLIGDY